MSVLVASLVLGVFGGCRPAPRASYGLSDLGREPGRAGLTEDEFGLLVGELDSGSGRPLVGLSAWTEHSRVRVHTRFTDGTPERILRSTLPGDRGGRRVNEITVGPVGAGEPDLRTVIALTGEGLVSLETLGGGVLSVFEPGALFLPAGLEAGEMLERAFGVRSSGGPIGRGSDGRGTVRIEGIGRQVIGTPIGLFDAFVVDSELSMKVGVARIVFARRMWIDDAFGLVAERTRDRVSVFGMTVRRRDWVSIIESETAGGAR